MTNPWNEWDGGTNWPDGYAHWWLCRQCRRAYHSPTTGKPPAHCVCFTEHGVNVIEFSGRAPVALPAPQERTEPPILPRVAAPTPHQQAVDDATAQLLIELAFLVPLGTNLNTHPIAKRLKDFQSAIEARARVAAPTPHQERTEPMTHQEEAAKVWRNLKGDCGQIAHYIVERCGDFVYDREREAFVAEFLRAAPAVHQERTEPPKQARVAAPTPAEGDDKVKDRLEELLGAFDTLYRYASDDGCPHAECHRYARPNRARIVLETWLGDYLTEGAAPQENEGENR